MGFKDKVLITAGICSLAFIGFITIKNYPGKEPLYSGVYYVTDETVDIGTQSGSSWDTLSSRNSVQCPGLDNTTPKGKAVITSGMTTKSNAYQISYLPFTKEDAGLSVKTITKNNKDSCGIQKGVAEGTISDFCESPTPSINDTYYEIIAPFSYYFDCQNTDTTSNSIVLVNRAKSCKVVIENPANWFCAGVYGTETVYGTGNTDNCTWEEHSSHHQTIIGKKSEKKSGGSGGELIGYGGPDTKITFYIISNGTWTPKSLFDLLNTSVK